MSEHIAKVGITLDHVGEAAVNDWGWNHGFPPEMYTTDEILNAMTHDLIHVQLGHATEDLVGSQWRPASAGTFSADLWMACTNPERIANWWAAASIGVREEILERIGAAKDRSGDNWRVDPFLRVEHAGPQEYTWCYVRMEYGHALSYLTRWGFDPAAATHLENEQALHQMLTQAVEYGMRHVGQPGVKNLVVS